MRENSHEELRGQEALLLRHPVAPAHPRPQHGPHANPARPLSERFARHKEVSDKIKAAVSSLGLKQVASNPADQAHGMTAIYLPESVKATDILPALAKRASCLPVACTRR